MGKTNKTSLFNDDPVEDVLAISGTATGSSSIDTTDNAMDTSAKTDEPAEYGPSESTPQVVSGESTETSGPTSLKTKVSKVSDFSSHVMANVCERSVDTAEKLSSMTGMGSKVSAIRHRKQRADRGWSDADAWSVDSWLLKTMPGILETLRRNGHSYPDGYARSKDRMLMPKTEDEYEAWLGSQPTFALFDSLVHDNKSIMGDSDLIKETPEGMWTAKKVKELDVDWVAWQEDLAYTIDVFREKAKMADDIYSKAAENERQSYQAAVNKEFRRVWNWLGSVFDGLWD